MFTEKRVYVLTIFLTLYLSALFATNTLGLKLMPFLWGTHLSTAVFFFPFVFLMTDIVGELYGKKMAKNFVYAGFLATVLFLIFTLVSGVMPWSEDGLWVKDAYGTVFGITFRMSVASLLAFVIGEYQDVIIFFLMKRLGSLPFWFRSNISNLWSQFLDTGIFMIVAFAGVYSAQTIFLMAIPWWLYKVAMGTLYTPLSYFFIHIIRKFDYENKSI